MSDADAAQLAAALILAALVGGLAAAGPRQAVVQKDGEYTVRGKRRRLARGTVLRARDVDDPRVARSKRSWLGAILAGRDNRTSTSKTVAFAWTLAVAYGLLAMVIAVILGDHRPWDAQLARGLQEEYLLLLGGPFAAAILAKQVTVRRNDTKTEVPVGNATASQLVKDDQGDTDLGDFQYVLFNGIALLFFLGDFVGDLDQGFPALPPLLTGLILTSTGGYAAKKLISQSVPILTSVVPPAARPGDTVQVFGANLTLPMSVSGTGDALKPVVHVGNATADDVAHQLALGNDRLTIKVPEGTEPGPSTVGATRADGVPARGPSGMPGLAFEVLAPVVPAAAEGIEPTGLRVGRTASPEPAVDRSTR